MDMNDNILQNTGVIITRPIDQSYSLINAIKQHSGSPILFPVLSIKPLKNSIIESNVKKLFNTSIIIFISSNAAKYGIDHINLTDKKIIAIGPTTRKYLEDNKINVSFCPEKKFNSEELLKSKLLKNVKNINITIVRGNSGRDLLRHELKNRGAKVQYLEVYKRSIFSHKKTAILNLSEQCIKGNAQFIVFLSKESFTNFIIILEKNNLIFPKHIHIIIPSERVANEVKDYSDDLQYSVASDARVQAILNVLKKHKSQKIT
tara:strand:- start:2492 stop:3274 length:783 start_codon:yes stop_codon:yes gene_type:complete